MKRTGHSRSTRPRLTCGIELRRNESHKDSVGRIATLFIKGLRRLRYRKTPKWFKYSRDDLAIAHWLSNKNQRFAASAKDCGCFHCLCHFKVEEIDWWSGETAFCPKCNLDSVLIETQREQVDDDLLKEMQAWYFESAQAKNSQRRPI